MAFLPTTASQIQQFAMALYGYQIGSITMAAVQADVAVLGGLNNTLNAYYNVSFGSLPTATVAANLVKNVGISTGDAAAIAYVKAILDTTPVASRGVAIEGILNAFSKMTADGTYGAAATYYNTRHAIAMNYTGESDVAVGTVPAVQVIPLTAGVDILTGTYLDDTFRAALGNDGYSSSEQLDGTLNPGDLINGGAGYDTLQMRVTENADEYVGFYGQLSAADVLGVEKFVIQNNADDTDVDLDLVNVDSALKDVEIVDSTGSDISYTFSNQQYSIDTFTVKRTGGSLDAGTVQNINFEYPSESLYAGANDTQTWNLENADLDIYSANYDNVGPTGVENAIENLVINSNGKENVFDWDDNYEKDVLKTVTIKGAGDLDLDLNSPDALTSIDASAMTGDLDFSNSNSYIEMKGDLTIKGSQGNNNFYDIDYFATVITTGADKQTFSFTSYEGIDQIEFDIYHSDANVNISTGGNADHIEVFNDAGGFYGDHGVEYTKLTINAGAGDDYVWLNELVSGASITLGGGNDILSIGFDGEDSWLDLGNLSSVSKAATEALKVTDFAAGDKLDLSECDNLEKVAFTNIELADIAAKTTLSAAITALDLDEEEYASFVWGGSTYIYFKGDNDFNGDAGDNNYDEGDGLIQLVGFTGALTSSNFVEPSI